MPGKPPGLPPELPSLGPRSGPPPLPPGLGAAASFPPAPPSFGASSGGGAAFPPAFPSYGAPTPPATFPGAGPAPAQGAGPGPERRIADLEKQLQEQREKVLLANLKSQEEKTISARVENSLKEIQDKLRRERRDAEGEETRLKLEARISELENRLIAERETWVSTLKGQMSRSESQDKEIETSLTMRIQEMERRWLEEKAHWQRVMNAKDEELRKRDSALERLKSAEVELERTVHDKKSLEVKVHELAQESATLKAQVTGAAEREREYYQVKAELTGTKDQLRNYQERYERDLAQLRSGAKEREERILADNERLQHDLATISARIRSEYESEVRRVRAEGEGELKKARAQADMAGAALQRMRAVGGALERQVASLRVQANEARGLKDELQKINDRYKAEFLVLQRKWQDREGEIRALAEKHFEKQLEAEKVKIKLRSTEEIANRVLKVQEQLRKEIEGETADRERALRAEMERAVAERTRRLEAELARKAEESEKRETYWREKLIEKEGAAVALRSAADEARARLAKEEEWRVHSSREKLDLEKSLAGVSEKFGSVQSALEELKDRLAEEQGRVQKLLGEREGWKQVEKSYEEKLGEINRHADTLEGRLGEAEQAYAALQKEKVELAETVAKIEAEHSRQLETWRRKLDLVRRDLEARVSALTLERDGSLREAAELKAGGLLGKLSGVFGGKKGAAPPPAPPPPEMTK